MCEFKVGDKVECVDGFIVGDNNGGGGNGYVIGKTFIISRVSSYFEDRGYVLFPFEDNGVWDCAVKHYGKFEPKKYIKKLHMV